MLNFKGDFIIRRPYDDIPLIKSDPGPKEKIFYSLTRDDHNNCYYKERSRVNIQDEVQSFREMCSLEAQLLRMQFAPIETVVQSLNSVNSVEGDFSSIPSDLVELNMLLQRCRFAIPNFDDVIKNKSFDQVINDIIKPLIKLDSESDTNNSGGVSDGETE